MHVDGDYDPSYANLPVGLPSVNCIFSNVGANNNYNPLDVYATKY